MECQQRRFRGGQSAGRRYLLCKTIRGAGGLWRLSQLCSRAGEYASERRDRSKVCADSYVYLLHLKEVLKSKIIELMYPPSDISMELTIADYNFGRE
jgi:hypothetical protein